MKAQRFAVRECFSSANRGGGAFKESPGLGMDNSNEPNSVHPDILVHRKVFFIRV